MPISPSATTREAPTPASALTVRAIVETFASTTARETLSGGPDSLERLVSSASTISSAEDLASQRPNSLVILPRSVAASGDVGLDLILRRAAAIRISCIVVDAGASALPTATARLAEQFRITLWREPELDPLELLSRIEHLVRNPELVGAGVIRTVSELMIRPAGDFGQIVTRLGQAIDYPTSLLGLDGRAIAGPEVYSSSALAELLATLDPGTLDTVLDAEPGQRLLLTAAFPLAVDQPRFWLAVQVPRGLDSRASHVLTAMRITSLALSTNLAQTSLTYERDNREAGSLLNDILSRADHLAVADVERATALGWQLFGWHVAVNVSAESSFTTLPAATLTQSMITALKSHGIAARPVRRGRSVVFWVTTTAPPDASQSEAFADVVRLSLDGMQRSFPGLRLRAGIGEPREGARGIAQSIDDAGLALAFAESSQGSSVVQRSETMTANRLIRSWIPDGAARDAVAAITDPLRDADTDGQLMATLSTYLDLESNASETANRLHVHRNTVLQRLQRIRELLTVDLDDPGDRLAVQVALRLR